MLNFRVTAPLALLSALVFCACGGSKTVNWDAACAGTSAGNGCLTLHVSMTSDVYTSANTTYYTAQTHTPHSGLTAPLMWALYNPSDVSDVGPANCAVAVNAGMDATADFSVQGSSVDIVIKDVTPQQYRALILLDELENLQPALGDPASLPHNWQAFNVPADVHTTYDIALDLITPAVTPSCN